MKENFVSSEENSVVFSDKKMEVSGTLQGKRIIVDYDQKRSNIYIFIDQEKVYTINVKENFFNRGKHDFNFVFEHVMSTIKEHLHKFLKELSSISELSEVQENQFKVLSLIYFYVS